MHNPPGSYSVDMADLIDKPDEIIADRIGVSLDQARQILEIIDEEKTEYAARTLSKVIGQLIISKNPLIMLHALSMTAGLDLLNGARSEAEVARKLGVSRALLSHYVVAWRDLLSGRDYFFDILKFRKRNSTREIYAEKATSPFLTAKAKALAKLKENKTK